MLQTCRVGPRDPRPYMPKAPVSRHRKGSLKSAGSVQIRASVDALGWRQIPVRTADPTSSDLDAPTYANRTLHADVPFALEIRELMGADPVGSRPLIWARIRRVVDYSAKLGRRRDVADDVDL